MGRSTMDRLGVLYLVYSFYCTGFVDGLILTLNKNAERNSDLQIIITTSSITSIVTLARPGGSSVNCGAPIGGPGICSTSDLSQDLTTGVTTYNVSSLVRSTDEGTWTASHGATDVNTIDIKVLTVPASITELTPAVTDFEVATSSSKTMTAVVECAYPSAQIDWEFVTETSASTGISPTRNTCTDMGLTGGSCSDAAAKTFHCDFTVTETSTASLSAGKYKLKANLYMDGEVTSTGISVELTPIITITGTPTPTPTPTNGTNVTRQCSCSWLPCGWKCHYVYIIAGVVFLVLLIVGVCCCYRHGYFSKKKEENRKKSDTNKVYDKNISGTENGQPTDSFGHHEHTAM